MSVLLQFLHKRASVAVRRVSKSWLVSRHSQSKHPTTSVLRPRSDHEPRFQERDCHIACVRILPQALWILQPHHEFPPTNNLSFAPFTGTSPESLRQFTIPDHCTTQCCWCPIDDNEVSQRHCFARQYVQCYSELRSQST